MAIQTQESPRRTEPEKTSGAKQIAAKDVKTLQAFWTKFNNDWVMNFAAGLAFNLITAIFAIVIAIVSIVGLVSGGLDSTIKADLIQRFEMVFPPHLSSGHLLGQAITT